MASSNSGINHKDVSLSLDFDENQMLCLALLVSQHNFLTSSTSTADTIFPPVCPKGCGIAQPQALG